MARASSVPTVQVRRVVKARPERVFELWTDPRFMVRWMSPYPGNVACRAEADVRVGGTFRLVMSSDTSICEIEGKYLAVEAPRKLVFTWSGPPTGNADTLVTVELLPHKNGTELTLTHEKLPTDEIRAGHATGWSNMLDHLEEIAA